MLPQHGQLLRIFIGESDHHEGLPLYEWLVRKAREEGLATVEKVEIRLYRSGDGGPDSRDQGS